MPEKPVEEDFYALFNSLSGSQKTEMAKVINAIADLEAKLHRKQVALQTLANYSSALCTHLNVLDPTDTVPPHLDELWGCVVRQTLPEMGIDPSKDENLKRYLAQ